jgi:hypothetical protein
MRDEPNTNGSPGKLQTTQPDKPTADDVRAALKRLRQLADGLPEVDAVAVVRAIRGEEAAR